MNFIKKPKHKRVKACEKCKRTIGDHESYFTTTVSVGGGCAIEEYCTSCGEELETEEGG